MNPLADAVLTIPEVAQHLHISRSKVYQLVQAGDMPSVRFGRSVRVLASDLVDWIEVHKAGRPSPSPICQIPAKVGHGVRHVHS